MVEVFTTNVNDPAHAKMILEQLHKTFVDHEANFDLDDCDRILRVKCTSGVIQTDLLICLLHDLGCLAEILPDEPGSISQDFLTTNYSTELKWEK